MTVAINHLTIRAGRVVAICQCCSKRSRPTKPTKHGEPDLFQMGRGWSEAPYPHDMVHEDGSVGSTFTCPPCNKRLATGEALRTRAGWMRQIA